MFRHICLSLLLFLISSVAVAGEVEEVDSSKFLEKTHELFNSTMFKRHSTDSVTRARHEKTFFHRLGEGFTRVFRDFTQVDSDYIEPQKYDFSAMLQNTNTYEMYRISSNTGHAISFAPEPSIRIGPYFGWRWIFLGYTLDLSHISSSSSDKNKMVYTISLYSNLFGVDLFWRETGNNYKIRNMNLGEDVDTSPMENVPFDGVRSTIKGFNVYYIFNHHRFSYPAAYSQSTRQKRSAGSVLMGVGYTRQSLSVDWGKLERLAEDRLGKTADELHLDSSLIFSRVHYSDLSASAGYSYNWVFSRHWLLNVSLSLALGYKYSEQDFKKERFTIHDIELGNFNLDGIGRLGLIYNNDKWYAGMSSIFHTYNYKKDQFSTNTMFGSVNFYVGFNFGKKK